MATEVAYLLCDRLREEEKKVVLGFRDYGGDYIEGYFGARDITPAFRRNSVCLRVVVTNADGGFRFEVRLPSSRTTKGTNLYHVERDILRFQDDSDYAS
ncbi:MAG: hypothetical protein ABIH49_02210 [archaeon]